ncbi:ABC-type transport system, periplasmic component [Sulfurimonas gotlandica GD1]|jgi:phospholipid/cholesterol/gamma-HCH transport system substrate-binding protein|uniref:ABC-type transport system, periplasmic component n=1 Tax=Sulfurimonas gotlandica (strain DSM 19862 / JCM 16533 / GD1) TaxID=929558 RepID=H1FXY3_SULGG|nr:MlaD family protein [Sulfurimonas gotlandica]EHP29490.1 ABC-type transport system, periplasmic component [Sulfurimonas gotlandica GD1]
MQYSKMKLAVGIFVISLFITIITFLYLVLEDKGTFNKRYNYHFTTDSASFFSVGMPLKFSGFDIGVIDNISLNDDGTVYMTFSVDEHNRRWMTDGTVLMIIKPLIGSAHIEVYSVIDNEVLEADAELQMLQNDDINDMISKLEPAVNKIISIINNIDAITAYIAKDDSDLMLTLQNIKKFTADLSNSDSLLTSITGDKKSTQSIIASLNKTTEIMKELQKISKDISKTTSTLDSSIVTPASSAIKELDKIMKDVKQKLDALDGTVKAVGTYDKDLVDLKEQISVSVQKSNQIMDKVDALMQDEQKQEVTLP